MEALQQLQWRGDNLFQRPLASEPDAVETLLLCKSTQPTLEPVQPLLQAAAISGSMSCLGDLLAQKLTGTGEPRLLCSSAPADQH